MSKNVLAVAETNNTELEVTPELEEIQVEGNTPVEEELVEANTEVEVEVKINPKPVVIHWDPSVDFRQRSGRKGGWRLRMVETGQILTTAEVDVELLYKAEVEGTSVWWKSQTECILVMVAIREAKTGVVLEYNTLKNLK